MTAVGGEVPPRGAPPEPGEGLFASVLIGAGPRERARWHRLAAPISLLGHLVVAALLVLVPILLPAQLPEQTDYIRALLYDPPPPPPPPLTRGSSLREQAKPETPKPVVETPKPTLTAPVETPRPVETARVEEPGVKPEDQFGSENGSDLFGDPLGMEEGVEGGIVGGVPGGVLGGVIGGTGTGPVMNYDAGPRVIRQTKPRYPQEAFVKKIEGRVEVEILIDAHGRVVRARIMRSVPLLDAAALQCVYEWLFRPAMKNGQPVPTIAHAPVDFRIF